MCQIEHRLEGKRIPIFWIYAEDHLDILGDGGPVLLVGRRLCFVQKAIYPSLYTLADHRTPNRQMR